MKILLRLLVRVFPYKRRVALAWLCVLGAGAFMVITPRLVQWGIDFGLQAHQVTETVVRDGVSQEVTRLAFESKYWLLIIAGAAVLGAALLRSAFAFGQQYLSEWLSARVAYDLRNAIYDRLQRLSYAYHDQHQTGQLMSRATQDVEAVQRFISMGFLRLLYILLLMLSILALMLLESPTLTLVCWPFLILIAAWSTRYNLKLRPVWTRVQDGLGRLTTVLQESLSGIRVVKAFGREAYESRKFAVEAQHLFDDSYYASKVQAVSTPLMTGLWMLSLAATIWFGGRELAAGRLSQGELAAFALYLTFLQMPVRMLGMIITLIARAHSSGERIFEILDADSAVKEKAGAPELRHVKGQVRFENVSFGYDAISPVLKDIDIDARPGQVIALLGPTGSGKTTIVNLLPRFYDVTHGRITIDGIDIRDVALASLRQVIGVVHQDVFLFSATIRENIAYGVPGATQEEIERVAKAARIHDFIMTTPEGYETWVGERGITLSGGQKQRVSIARTLLQGQPILILDDSTSSVDTETEYLIQQALAEIMRGRTTFVIAQRLRTVELADQILVLDEGRIVERGRHQELLEHNGFYRQIYDLELRDQEEALPSAPLLGQPAPASLAR